MKPAGAFRGGRAAKRGAGGVVAAAGGAAPTITSITPSSGAAGTAVVVIGTNFVAGATCTVGGVSITPSVTNSTRIEGTTGAHVNGLVDVVVTTANGSDTETLYTYSSAVAPLFKSDWSTATGSSDAAVRDTGKSVPWPHADVGSPTQTLSVVAAPTGFPGTMTNVLRVIAKIGGSCYILPADNIYAVRSIGQSLFFRYYIQVPIPDADGDQTSHINACHHIQAGVGNASDLWGWNFAPKNDGKFRFEGHTYGYPVDNGAYDGWGLVSSGPGYLNKAVAGSADTTACYRVEWKITKTATSVYDIDARIYDRNDVLLYSDDGIGASIGAIYQLGHTGVKMSVDGIGKSMDDTMTKGFQIGSNNGGLTTAIDSYFYFGGVCIRSDDWCGAYSTVTG